MQMPLRRIVKAAARSLYIDDAEWAAVRIRVNRLNKSSIATRSIERNVLIFSSRGTSRIRNCSVRIPGNVADPGRCRGAKTRRVRR